MFVEVVKQKLIKTHAKHVVIKHFWVNIICFNFGRNGWDCIEKNIEAPGVQSLTMIYLYFSKK